MQRANTNKTKKSMGKLISIITGLFLFSFTAISQTGTPNAKVTSVQKNELTKIYTKAIDEYIKVVFKKNKLKFDTLYIGKRNYGQPDDFPNIKLPATIQNTKILLLTNEEATKLKFGKSTAYINMIGSVGADTAEFVFITFNQGFKHNFDCFIDYKYNAKQKEFELERLRFEDYFFNKEGKLERIAIYKDGKYVGDKPIK